MKGEPDVYTVPEGTGRGGLQPDTYWHAEEPPKPLPPVVRRGVTTVRQLPNGRLAMTQWDDGEELLHWQSEDGEEREWTRSSAEEGWQSKA